MTAKEALRHLVDDLSEEEASAWLERMAGPGRGTTLTTFARAMRREIISHRTDKAAALALLRKWRSEGPVMTEEEWDEFAKAVDEGRPERPLFA